MCVITEGLSITYPSPYIAVKYLGVYLHIHIHMKTDERLGSEGTSQANKSMPYNVARLYTISKPC